MGLGEGRKEGGAQGLDPALPFPWKKIPGIIEDDVNQGGKKNWCSEARGGERCSPIQKKGEKRHCETAGERYGDDRGTWREKLWPTSRTKLKREKSYPSDCAKQRGGSGRKRTPGGPNRELIVHSSKRGRVTGPSECEGKKGISWAHPKRTARRYRGHASKHKCLFPAKHSHLERNCSRV